MYRGEDESLSQALERVPSRFRILFVCTGNTCRSPIAEAIARSEAKRRDWRWLKCGSAGTFALRDEPASELAEIVARCYGLDLRGHRARALAPRLVEEAQLVLGMGPSHVNIARELDPGSEVALLTGYLPPDHSERDAAVPDPAGGSLLDYEATLELLTATIQGLFEQLEERFGRS